jgi:hypothetical protein
MNRQVALIITPAMVAAIDDAIHVLRANWKATKHQEDWEACNGLLAIASAFERAAREIENDSEVAS